MHKNIFMSVLIKPSFFPHFVIGWNPWNLGLNLIIHASYKWGFRLLTKRSDFILLLCFIVQYVAKKSYFCLLFLRDVLFDGSWLYDQQCVVNTVWEWIVRQWNGVVHSEPEQPGSNEPSVSTGQCCFELNCVKIFSKEV